MYEENKDLWEKYKKFLPELVKAKYAYNFSWCGIKILKLPQDIQAIQEIIWKVKPEVIIDIGVAAGGSLMLHASMLSILESCNIIDSGLVIGIDINIYEENRKIIEEHPFSSKIFLIDGSSLDDSVLYKVYELVNNKNVIICLDSNHTHDHVLSELRLYSPIVKKGGYIIVEDTGIEDLSNDVYKNRSWGKGNNPKTAVWQFMKETNEFIIDKEMDSKLILTGSPDGYLKRVK